MKTLKSRAVVVISAVLMILSAMSLFAFHAAVAYADTSVSNGVSAGEYSVTADAVTSGSGTDMWWIWLLVATLVVVLVIFVILVAILLRKNAEPVDDGSSTVIVKTETKPNEEDESADEEPEQNSVAPAEEEQPQSADETRQAEEETAAAEEEIIPAVGDGRTVLDKSFTARLHLSEEAVKQYYSDLKNDILSYKGVKSRVSWHFDTFNKGRLKLIKLQFRGKSLYMYIALNAAELDEKYHAKDMSGTARFEEVPCMLKIRSDRSFKYAKQLVAILMESLEIQRGETPNVNYKLRRRSLKWLQDEGLIKVKATSGSFASPAKNEE